MDYESMKIDYEVTLVVLAFDDFFTYTSKTHDWVFWVFTVNPMILQLQQHQRQTCLLQISGKTNTCSIPKLKNSRKPLDYNKSLKEKAVAKKAKSTSVISSHPQ